MTTSLLVLPDRRKSRGTSTPDPYPSEGYVRCTDDLTVYHLDPGQWSITAAGRLMLRTTRGEFYDLELGGLQ